MSKAASKTTSRAAAKRASALEVKDAGTLAFKIERRDLLKELGLYTVRIHLHSDINAELKVWIVPTVTEDGKDTGGDAK